MSRALTVGPLRRQRLARLYNLAIDDSGLDAIRPAALLSHVRLGRKHVWRDSAPMALMTGSIAGGGTSRNAGSFMRQYAAARAFLLGCTTSSIHPISCAM